MRNPSIDFIEKSQRASDELSLIDAFADAVAELGFDSFLAWTVTNPENPAPGSVDVHRYPSGWKHYYLENKFWDVDPTHRFVRAGSRPFQWRDLKYVGLKQVEQRFMLELDAAGLADGVSVPVHSRYSLPGHVALTGRGDKVTQRDLSQLHFLGLFFYESAKRLTLKREGSILRVSTLTGQQRECLQWLAVGKVDWEISDILGISEAEVCRQIENIKRAYGVPNRTQAVVQALLSGQILPK